MRSLTLGPGILFLVAVVALAGVAIADLAFVGSSQRSGFDHGGFESNEERGILAKSVVMRPGDRLVVQPNLGSGGWPTFQRYHFYVVNGGDRYALLDGEAPRTVYAQVTNMSLQGCCPNGWLAWDRPDDALAHREPRPSIETGPGIDVDMRELILSVTDHPDRIDLVWVLEYGPEARRDLSAEERKRFDSDVERDLAARLAFQPMFDPGAPTVYSASVAAWHPRIVAAMACLALLGAGAALWWGARVWRARLEPAGQGTESLLRLYDAAGAYLASLRDLLAGSLVVVLGVALHVALVGEPEAIYQLLRYADVGRGASAALRVALMLLYAAVLVVWVYAVWAVQRALRRWRRREAPPDLADATLA